jgi:hypothetical protein
MRKVMVLLLFAAVAVIGLSAYTSVSNGQEKQAAAEKQMRWSGHIVRIDTEHSFMDVRDPHGAVQRIYWDNATTWSKLNKTVTNHSEFKEEQRVICLGKPGEKGAFLATRIDLRVHQ